MGCRQVEFATTESKVVTMELTWGLHEQRDVVWDYFLVLVADVLGDCKLFQVKGFLKDHHTSIDLCQFQWIVLVILAVWATIKESPPPCRRDDFDCYLQNGLCTFWREQALELGSKLATWKLKVFWWMQTLTKMPKDPKRSGAAGFSGLSFDSARAHRTQRVNLSKVFCPCGLSFQRHVQTLGSENIQRSNSKCPREQRLDRRFASLGLTSVRTWTKTNTWPVRE